MRFILRAVLVLAMHGTLFAATDWIAQLKSPDINTRRTAIDAIQTLDDSRIPDACLPLLADPGLSIRRQAARAIGSRFYEISKARLPVFIEAIRKYESTADPDDRIVAQRTLGLLTRDASNKAFSRSPDGKWILYEQRRRPMIARSDFEGRQLLAPVLPRASRVWPYWDDSRVALGNIVDVDRAGSHMLKLMATSDSAGNLFNAHWQPRSLGVELAPDFQAKFLTPVILWRSSDKSYRVFALESFQSIYGKRFPHWSTIVEFARWDGPRALFRIYDCDDGGGLPYDPKGITVAVDIRTWKLSIADRP